MTEHQLRCGTAGAERGLSRRLIIDTLDEE